MGIDDWFVGKFTSMLNKKGKPDLTREEAVHATSAIQKEAGLKARKEIGEIIDKFDDKIMQAPPEKYRREQNIQADIREGLKTQESFKALFQGFSADVLSMRKMVVEYNNLSEARLREIKGDEILSEFENIQNKIEEQIAVTNDPNEKADFDNIRIELKNIVKDVSGSVEKMRASE